MYVFPFHLGVVVGEVVMEERPRTHSKTWAKRESVGPCPASKTQMTESRGSFECDCGMFL